MPADLVLTLVYRRGAVRVDALVLLGIGYESGHSDRMLKHHHAGASVNPLYVRAQRKRTGAYARTARKSQEYNKTASHRIRGTYTSGTWSAQMYRDKYHGCWYSNGPEKNEPDIDIHFLHYGGCVWALEAISTPRCSIDACLRFSVKQL